MVGDDGGCFQFGQTKKVQTEAAASTGVAVLY